MSIVSVTMRCHGVTCQSLLYGLWLSAVVRRSDSNWRIEKIKKFAARLQAAVADANACVIFILFEFRKLHCCLQNFKLILYNELCTQSFSEGIWIIGFTGQRGVYMLYLFNLLITSSVHLFTIILLASIEANVKIICATGIKTLSVMY